MEATKFLLTELSLAKKNRRVVRHTERVFRHGFSLTLISVIREILEWIYTRQKPWNGLVI